MTYFKVKRGVIHNLKKLKNSESLSYRSSLEKKFIQYLENSEKFVGYLYEAIKIPYIYKGTQRIYIPDFLVKTKDQEYILIEVKPHNQVNLLVNKLKFKAAEEYLKRNNKGVKFKIITEKFLDKMTFF